MYIMWMQWRMRLVNEVALYIHFFSSDFTKWSLQFVFALLRIIIFLFGTLRMILKYFWLKHLIDSTLVAKIGFDHYLECELYIKVRSSDVPMPSQKS